MNRHNLFYAFEFKNDALRNDQVEALSRKLDGLVRHTDLDLPPSRDCAKLEFVHQGSLVDGFDEPGAKVAMDLDRRAEDGMTRFFQLARQVRVLHWS